MTIEALAAGAQVVWTTRPKRQMLASIVGAGGAQLRSGVGALWRHGAGPLDVWP